MPGGTKTQTTEQLTEQLGTITKERDDEHVRAERAETAVRVLVTQGIATKAVNAIEGMPKEAQDRVIERSQPVLKDGELDRAATTAAIEKDAADEADYLARNGAMRGGVSGMGSGVADDEAVGEAAMEADFSRMGLSESAAKTAARGRSH